MGCGCSRSRVAPNPHPSGALTTSSHHQHETLCSQCRTDGHHKVASWWCKDCRHHICNYCAWNHSNQNSTYSHSLIPISSLDKPKSAKPPWVRQQETKQAVLQVYFDTKADLHYVDLLNYREWTQQDGEEHVRGRCLLPQVNTCFCRKRYVTESVAIISACAFLPGGYIAVTDYLNEEVKLFDDKYNCMSYIKLTEGKPRDICAHGSNLFLATEGKCHLQKIGVSLPLLCFGRKLSLERTIKTEGECDSVSICKFSYFSSGLVVGMTFTQVYSTKRHQVHVMSFSGVVKKTLYYDDSGMSLFWSKVYVSGTPIPWNIVVSDKVNDSVRGFDLRTGETTFNQPIKEPLGISVDDDDNVYVVTNPCLYWIPPHRESVIPFLKRGHRSRSTNCCYDNKRKLLAVTSSHSETVQLYRLI